MAAVSAAIMATAMIASAAMAQKQQKKQQDAADAAARRVEQQRKEAEAEKLRIAQEARPEGEAVEGIAFGAKGTGTDVIDDFVQKRTSNASTSGLKKSSGTSGLGFAI